MAVNEIIKPLGFDPIGKDVFSVPCVVLGLGEKSLLLPNLPTVAQFNPNNAKGWHEAGGTRRPLAKIAETTIGTAELEGGGTYMRVAPPRNGTKTVDDPGIAGATNQDGGNGSGGDSGAQEYFADMIESRRAFTFWKRASPGGQTSLGTSSNASIASIYQANLDPGFARLFPSHHLAMDFLAKDGAFVYELFEYVLVVAVRADLSTFVTAPKPGDC